MTTLTRRGHINKESKWEVRFYSNWALLFTFFTIIKSGGTKTTDFWNRVKPFFSKKCKSGDQKIILCEDNKIINNSNEVSNLFNKILATVHSQLVIIQWMDSCIPKEEMMGTLLICISKMATPGRLQFSYDLYRRYHS
jgi:hypothetical protein